jgi:hypothetical protein
MDPTSTTIANTLINNGIKFSFNPTNKIFEIEDKFVNQLSNTGLVFKYNGNVLIIELNSSNGVNPPKNGNTTIDEVKKKLVGNPKQTKQETLITADDGTQSLITTNQTIATINNNNMAIDNKISIQIVPDFTGGVENLLRIKMPYLSVTRVGPNMIKIRENTYSPIATISVTSEGIQINYPEFQVVMINFNEPLENIKYNFMRNVDLFFVMLLAGFKVKINSTTWHSFTFLTKKFFNYTSPYSVVRVNGMIWENGGYSFEIFKNDVHATYAWDIDNCLREVFDCV